MGESPLVRYSVCLMASTCGSAAACSRNAWTDVEKRVVRVVQQHVAAADGGEDVARLGRLDLVEVAVGARQERGELQLRPVEVGHDRQPAQVERLGQAVDLVRDDAELAQQQVGVVLGDVVGELEADRRAEPAAQQLLLQGLEQVLRVVLLDLEVLVAGDAERRVPDDVHAGEQQAQVRGDDVLERDERRAVVVVAVGVRDPEEPRQHRRHLDPGEVLLARRRVGHDDGEVEREPGDVRERVGRVDGERGEDREDLVRNSSVRREQAWSSSWSQRSTVMPCSAMAGSTSSR